MLFRVDEVGHFIAILVFNHKGKIKMDQVWTNLFLAWGVQAGSLLSPGPSVLFLLAVASSRGRTHALAASIGIGGAAIVWSTATVAGLSAILSEAGNVLVIMKFIGAGYLAWLAWKSFRSAAFPSALNVQKESLNDGLFKTVGRGFVMQISNPKAIFFWLAIASLGATTEGPGWVSPVFIVVAVTLSLLIHAGWAFVFSTAAAASIYGRAQRWIDGILGVMFAAAASRLASSEM